MINIKEAQENLNKLINTPYEKFRTPEFSKYAPAYIAPTSNVVDTMSLYKEAKKVLCVGGTGAHGLTAALNGATSVDMYDININQRIFYELLIAAIKVLPYEEFILYFSLKEQPQTGLTYNHVKDFLSLEMYFKICDALPCDVKEILDSLYY